MKRLLALALLLAASTAAARSGGSVVGSKHDLSVTGPGPIRALRERNVCAPCHIAHVGISNRPDPGNEHVPYGSSTMTAKAGRPTGATRICLSCHDGTIAVGETKGGRIQMTVGAIPADRPSNLGTDLRKTHPVSFHPVAGARTHKPHGGDAVQLDRSGQLQCTSCHDPHAEWGDPLVGKFLVKPSQRSALCLSCHDSVAVDAPGSSHATSTAAFSAAQGNVAGFASVGDAGCAACHRSHGGDGKGRLLDRPRDDDDAPCLRCHGGAVARQNIGLELTKPYAHGGQAKGVHDASEARANGRAKLPEPGPGATRHVACVDCHNPHAATSRPAVAPGVGGALAGVWGIDATGQRVEAVRYEYEVCLKCHGDSANKPQQGGPARADAPRRALVDVNLRQVLAASAPSFHPVIAPGRNPRVPGLVPPYTPASQIACSDCHGSEGGPGGSGPRGPHGSVNAFLLAGTYRTADNTPESPLAYALCYRCHDRETLVDPARRDLARYPDPTAFLGTGSPPSGHPLHLGARVNAPCSACHAAHGVSAQAGTPDENAHLVDFDVSIVKPFRGVRRYRAQGPGSGSCTLTCHGKDHDGAVYSALTALRR